MSRIRTVSKGECEICSRIKPLLGKCFWLKGSGGSLGRQSTRTFRLEIDSSYYEMYNSSSYTYKVWNRTKYLFITTYITRVLAQSFLIRPTKRLTQRRQKDAHSSVYYTRPQK